MSSSAKLVGDGDRVGEGQGDGQGEENGDKVSRVANTPKDMMSPKIQKDTMSSITQTMT